MHTPGQRVKRLEPLYVHRERGIASAAFLRSRPFRRGEHRDRALLGVGEADLLVGVALGQFDERRADALLELLEAVDGQSPVGGTGEHQDRIGHLGIRVDCGPAVAGTPEHDPVAIREAP